MILFSQDVFRSENWTLLVWGVFYFGKQTLQQKLLFSLWFTLLLQVTGVQNWC